MEKRYGLGKLNPTVRLVFFIVVSLVAAFAHSWSTVIFFLLLGVALLVAGRKCPKTAIGALISVFVFTFAGNALLAKDEAIVFSFFIFRLSPASIDRGLMLGCRIVAMMLSAIAFAASTPIHEFLPAFRGLRIPKITELYLMILLRYVGVTWYEIRQSMMAMKIRGVEFEGSPVKRVIAFKQLMTPMFYRIIIHISGQALAIDSRGGVKITDTKKKVEKEGPAVSLRGVSVVYDLSSNEEEKLLALKGIDLVIQSRETCAVVGKTGSGRSTLSLLCCGLIPLSVGRMKGEVRIFGYDTRKEDLPLLASLSRIVFPSAVQGLVGLTVEDELLLSLRVTSVLKEEYGQVMSQALESVGLDGTFLARQTLSLSGGEMQRVALASAIVAQAPILVLDDVTTQLDPKGRREVSTALLTLRDKIETIILTDASITALPISKYVFLEDGEVVKIVRDAEHDLLEKAHVRIPQIQQLGIRLGFPLRSMEEAKVWGQKKPKIRFKETAGSQDSEIVLQARSITFLYDEGNQPAVQDLTIAFRGGEFTAILGANGSGKTTLGLILAQAYKPQFGQVFIDGEKVGPRARGKVGYVFQEPMSQMLTMSVQEELEFGPRQLGWSEEEIRKTSDEVIQLFSLSPEASPIDLSPAQTRFLAIASILAMKPKVLILDEPTNGLDEVEAQRLMKVLKRLQREGMTIILIIHDVELAAQYADRIVVMKKGSILVDGQTREVMSKPDILAESEVTVPDITSLSLSLWPEHPPALTVEEMVRMLPIHNKNKGV